jgi:hypothetical protein
MLKTLTTVILNNTYGHAKKKETKLEQLTRNL